MDFAVGVDLLEPGIVRVRRMDPPLRVRREQPERVLVRVVNAVVERPALVVGLPPAMVRTASRDFMRAGGWAHHFPHPDPDLEDPIIYARESISAPNDLTLLLKRFPERNVYRIEYGQGDVPVTVVRIR